MEQEPSEPTYDRESFAAIRSFINGAGDSFPDGSIEAYFQEQFFSTIEIRSSYRNTHNIPFSQTDVQTVVDMFDKMVPLVTEAYDFLGMHAKPIVDMWQASAGETRIAYTTVIADLIENSPGFVDRFYSTYDGDKVRFHADCYNTAQWLDGWLRSENS